MNKKNKILIIALSILVVLSGAVAFAAFAFKKDAPKPAVVEEKESEDIPQVDESVLIEVTKSAVKDNTVSLKVSGLSKKYKSLEYELSYDSQGLIKGVNSGSNPIDISNQDEFIKEIFLGSCSRNVCRADQGVNQVSLVMEFADNEGKKSQFIKDFDL